MPEIADSAAGGEIQPFVRVGQRLERTDNGTCGDVQEIFRTLPHQRIIDPEHAVPAVDFLDESPVSMMDLKHVQVIHFRQRFGFRIGQVPDVLDENRVPLSFPHLNAIIVQTRERVNCHD